MSIDVAAKLAQGAAAVGAIEKYVAASHAVGCPAAGLSVAGVRELYASEAGLRLDALDADSEALAGLADAAEEGMRLEAEAHESVRQAWQGASGTVAAEFIERHLATGSAVVESLRDASTALRSLRDELAGLVEQKVGAAVHFDDRWAAEHPVWLAEAEAVLQGLADDIAVEVVSRQISPYIDGDVQSAWIPAMRDATDSVSTAYDGAVARLSDRPAAHVDDAHFGDAGTGAPSAAPLPAAAPPQSGAAAQAAWPQWASGLSSAMSPGMSGLSGLGGGGLGLPGLGGGDLGGAAGLTGGLPALIGRIADALGSYSGPPDLSATDELGPRHRGVHGDGKKSEGQEDQKDAPGPDSGEQSDSPGEAVPSQGEGPVAEASAPAVQSEERPFGGAPVAQPAPQVPPPPTVSAPPPAQVAPSPGPVQSRPVEPVMTGPPTLPPPLAAEVGAKPAAAAVKPAGKPETPCSIAADELPQIGQ